MSKEEHPPTSQVCHLCMVLRTASYAMAFVFILIIAATFRTLPAHAIVAMTTPASVVNRQIEPTRTRTPTPTLIRAAPTSRSAQFRAAPQSVPGQPQVDANTLALYHFDSPSETAAIDATGRYTGTLVGNATITSLGVYAGALRLDGASGYVSIGYLGDTLSSGTIEAFVDFSEACNTPSDAFPIVTVVGPAGVVLSLEENSGLRFGIYANNKWNWADSGINACRYLKSGNTFNPPPWEDVPIRWPYEVWRFHHVAATWGPRGMEIWVDGVLHGVGNDDPNAGIWPYPYMCNPQDQMMSSIYPLCKTPVMAPTMTVYPRGDYTGGLLPYHTVFIGYNPSLPAVPPSNPYFKGRIEEVRISNIQRTFHWSVVPTITPTPTQTPVPITGEYAVDGSTLVLYHLNTQSNWRSVYDEVTQTWNAGLGGNAMIVPGGRFGNALWLDGNGSYIQIPNNLPGNGTIEMWINLSNVPNHFAIFSLGDATGSDRVYLGINQFLGQTLVLSVYDADLNVHTVDSGFRPIPQCWHHIAGSWGWQGLKIWVDGTLRGTQGYYGAPLNNFSRELVGCSSAFACAPGLIDEVRLSSVQRTFTRAGILAGAYAAGRVPVLSRSANAEGKPVYLPFIFLAPTPLPSPTPTCPN